MPVFNKEGIPQGQLPTPSTPQGGYILVSAMGVPYGVATLGSDGKLLPSQSPTVSGGYVPSGGSTGQSLVKLSGTNFDTGWQTISIATISPLTTKGDILTYSSVNARLGIGANATILMADSGATTGNKWVALSGESTIATTGVVTLTNSAVIGKVLTGYVSGSGTVAATDTILQAIQKLNGNIGLLSGTVTSVAWTTSQGVSASISNPTTTPNITITMGALTGVTSFNGLIVTANTGVITTGTWNATKIGLTYGGTNADLSATGGTSQVLKQTSVGGNVTVAQLAASDLSNGTTGSGAVVLATSPTLVTPILGVASCTSIAVTGTGGSGFVKLATQSSSPTAVASNGFLHTTSSGGLGWMSPSTVTTAMMEFSGSILTADRVFTVPDKTGTLALDVVIQNTFRPPFANASTVTNITSGDCFCVCVGKARKAWTTATIRYRISTTSASGITWAEMAIYKGTPVVGGAATLSRLGYADISGQVNATGPYTIAVTISGVSIGDDLWVVFGMAATTMGTATSCVGDTVRGGFANEFTGQPSATASPTTTLAASASRMQDFICQFS